jgi:class 3 adenylate cyclase
MEISTTHALMRYVPRVASEWDFDAPRRQWQTIDSTLCFVDLSGFTSLSERLARRGRIGAEELTDVLDRVFGHMLSIAYQRGGTLLKFGGDALLLHFATGEHTTQAACAAVEMREALRDAARVTTSVGRVALRMSVGIHTGTVHLFRVGVTHRELIVTGPAATQVALMESAADAGEILLSPEAAQRLPRHAVGQAKGPGMLLRWRRPPVPPVGASSRRRVDHDTVAQCLPVVLRDALSAGPIEPEHRVATIGFVKFEGIDSLMADHGPDATAAALHELVRTVQEEAAVGGVTLLATDVDKNGGKLILVTGVPATQHDDAGRMMRTLRAIADAGTRLPVRIGAHRGHVYAGAVGGPHRATFTVIGDTVNLSARLMASAAPGQVYATPGVLDRSGTLFASEALAPFYVRGKSEPVQAYSVGHEIGPRTDTSSGGLPFVGRTHELQQLTDAIDRARAGAGSVVTVVGATGVGKSRLIEKAMASARDLPVFTVRAEHAGSTAPYRSFRDPVRALLGIERDDPQVMADQLRKAVEAIEPALLPVLPLLGDVAHIDVPRTDVVDRIELRFRPDRTAAAVAGLLSGAVPGPMLMIVEDAQWMDSASAALIERLAESGVRRGCGSIIARRPEPGGATPRHDALIELEPLDAQLAAEAVVAATSGAPLRPHEIGIIVARSGGNPLFLGELVRMSRGGRVEDLPDSLDAVISAELDTLGVLARRLVRYASVLGGSFRVSVLREVLASEQIDLDDATTHELGRFLEYEGSDRVRFRHTLMRERAYQGLPYRRRRELHLRAGLVNERLAAGATESVADVLAAHFALAHEYAKAWKYAVVAGDRARDQYANLEAV